MPDGLVIVDKPAGLDLARRGRPGSAGWPAPARSGTPAPWTRWRPACWCSAWAGPPGCCSHLVLADKEYTATIRLGQATTPTTPRARSLSVAAGGRTDRATPCAPRCAG